LWQACWLQSYRQIAILLALLALGTWCVSIPKGDASLWALDSYNTGLQALESNNLATAARKLELAHAYVPENAEVNFALGNLNLARGNRKAAKSYYYATLRLDPRHEGSYNNLGVLSLEDKNWPLAAECFRRALGQNPRDPKTHFLLAKVKLEQGDRIAAHREIARALELDPKPSEFSALRSAIDRAGP
jgi:tetratricopeptide (TPR) repeat protein